MSRFTFRQQVLTGFAVSLLFVLISAATSYRSVRSLDKDMAWVAHTYEVISTVQGIEQHMLNAETGMRGYVITQREKYLEPYRNNVGNIMPEAGRLTELVADNPVQHRMADSMAYYLRLKIADMAAILNADLRSGEQAARALVMTDQGKIYKDKVLAISQQLIRQERKLLEERKAAMEQSQTRTTWIVTLSALIIFLLILYLFSFIQRTFRQQKQTENQIRHTNEELTAISAENEHRNWLLTGASNVYQAMRGVQDLEKLAERVVAALCKNVGAIIGGIYSRQHGQESFVLSGAFAFEKKREYRKPIAAGEGLVGTVALEKQPRLLSQIPENYIKVSSGLGNTSPSYLYLVPVVFKDETIAVIELGFIHRPEERRLALLQNVTESIGIAMNSANERQLLQNLFDQTQQQAEELESQQEELRTTNEELMQKTEMLQASEEELRVQQEELTQTNAELEEKAQLLEEQNHFINEAKDAISAKAAELELTGKYKSEFLANMSHELRTPLNSILILARILRENKTANLTPEQIKYAGVIHNAGNDLLVLINDILDLSKIESGKLDLLIEPLHPEEIKTNLELLFDEVAKNKNVGFSIDLSPNLPARIVSDKTRLEQVIKNLLSNAFKFTPEQGSIRVSIAPAAPDTPYYQPETGTNGRMLAIAVSDTGIGIPEDKQKLIFEAFQQADGSTNRKYGGTGLGLSISRELARLLGGEIQVQSHVGQGSTFTLFIPEQLAETSATEIEEQHIKPPDAPVQLSPEAFPVIAGEGKRILIVEDDTGFADILADYAREKGYEPLVAHSGDTGLELAQKERPDAIILDIMLPVMSGWTIIKKLKSDPLTRDIPVHMMSAGEGSQTKAQHEGAIGFLQKPLKLQDLDHLFGQLNARADYRLKNVLLIEDQETQSNALRDQLLGRGIGVAQAYTGKEALQFTEEQDFDCIILDLRLPDTDGFALLDTLKSRDKLKDIPVVINTAKELDRDEIARIQKHTQSMVLKTSKSNDRLLDEVSLFINKLKNQDMERRSAATRAVKSVSTIEKALKGKNILITDDDMRNIFALSSALQEYEMNIIIATNGREALEKLEEHPQTDMVLMDVMMPEMDGYEAMQKIREQSKYSRLPIIALTAKAMKNDREKCIEAGANDYISKPVEMEKLLSMMRVWLS
ncbi:histidine kinase [Pedobacter yulinensis]|uniref:histidine kinase n=1 Tax=Pedobacter yulinensis TaxID=2126353 RepID=A0A2T3HQ90_9SPHI|nr:response regulator [Pedobacter yulinensis]PST84596.1 histidine kinase [Pedobacter yulinensis]